MCKIPLLHQIFSLIYHVFAPIYYFFAPNICLSCQAFNNFIYSSKAKIEEHLQGDNQRWTLAVDMTYQKMLKLQFVKEKNETVFQSIMNDIYMIHLFALDKESFNIIFASFYTKILRRM